MPLEMSLNLDQSIQMVKGRVHVGRSLATITKIYGRIRNMLVLPNGDRQWPTYGETHYMNISSKIEKDIK